MGRFCGDKDVTAILSAAELWRDQSLNLGLSPFDGSPIWNLTNLEELDRAFTQNPDFSGNRFIDKLREQLKSASDASKQLAAEINWLLLLCPANILPRTKLETLRSIWSWTSKAFPESHSLMSVATLSGIGSAGPGFNNHRPREMTFAINMLHAFYKEDLQARQALSSDPWRFDEWLSAVTEAETRQFRHMILYLLFPDTFERIFSIRDRRRVAVAFSEKDSSAVHVLNPLELDKLIADAKHKLKSEHGTNEIDFYWPPLLERWNSYVAITQDHVRSALLEIDRDGVPGNARSTTYDLVVEGKRYPPKLVFSIAYRHATGKVLERREFSAGADTSLFARLRDLGFTVVQKGFISELVNRFLSQADDANNLQTITYPKEYRGLRVEVSFGKGSFSRVPWIAFLSQGQRVSEGIYPVLLYFRDTRLLILAYGVSEANSPTGAWSDIGGAKTIEAFFQEKYHRAPERYGASFVDTTYEIPGGLDTDALAARLDSMIELYTRPPSGSKQAPEPETLAEPPYTIEQALEGLFISEEEFGELLDQLETNKNIILQGPPGVGKTFFAERLARAFIGADAPSRIKAVQFHASYSYEDFVQGYRPDGKGGFERKDGVFLRFSRTALADQSRRYVFIIDEINRANLSKVLGEVLMLIEGDKRRREFALDLAYSSAGEVPFYVPDNLYIIGLMNTADRSLALVDYALRRRFDFITLEPGFDREPFDRLLSDRGVPESVRKHLVKVIGALNKKISEDKDLGPGFKIGHSYFCTLQGDEDAEESYRKVIEYKIAPLLREYWYEGPNAQSWCDELLKL